MTEPLYALIWRDGNGRHCRVCPDLFVTCGEAYAHAADEHSDLASTDVSAIRSDLLPVMFPDHPLDAPDAIAMHVKDGAPPQAIETGEMT